MVLKNEGISGLRRRRLLLAKDRLVSSVPLISSLRRANRAKNILLAIDRMISKPDVDSDEIAHIASRQVGKLLHTTACVVSTIDERESRLNIIAGHHADEIVKYGYIPLESLSGEAVLKNSVLKTSDIQNDKLFHYKAPAKELGFVSSIVHPIRVGAKAIGAITVFDSRKRDFTVQEQNLLKHFSTRIASAMERSRLFLTDHGTGVGNRRRLFNKLEEALGNLSDKERITSPASFVLLDLDGFKQINDKLGHDSGDKYLRSVAKLLIKAARKHDTIARYGGDEFGVVLPKTDKKGTQVFLERLEAERKKLNEKRLENHEPPLEFSIGFHTAESASETADGVLKKADERLYADKVSRRKEER